MTAFVIAPIVEGYGDVSAVPELLRRMRPDIVTLRPIRVPRGRIVRAEILERYVGIARANIDEAGGQAVCSFSWTRMRIVQGCLVRRSAVR